MIKDDELKRKKLFIAVEMIGLVMIFLYEILTPMLMDDMSYGKQVVSAGSFFGLFAQEANQYMTWTGRSVAHIILRICIFIDAHLGTGRMFFNMLSSACFCGLTYLIYANADSKKRYDVVTYAMGILLVWTTGVCFSQTILWETGACNYLFTTTIILTVITVFRSFYAQSLLGKEIRKEKLVPTCILMFLLGMLGGWCNENTSGGMLLILLAIVIYNRKITSYAVCTIAGACTGLAMMVLAPGNANRAQYMDEAHSGLMKYAARLIKITLEIKQDLLILIAAVVVLLIILYVQGKRFEEMKGILLYLFVAMATCYSLIFTATSQSRAYFGAGIFLIIAVLKGFVQISEGLEDSGEKVMARIITTLKYSVVAVIALYLFFDYAECGANLARIYGEMSSRYGYLESLSQTDARDAEVPWLHPQFDNRFTAAYISDVTDDWQNWNNKMLAEYYGFDTLLGVDPDEQ